MVPGRRTWQGIVTETGHGAKDCGQVKAEITAYGKVLKDLGLDQLKKALGPWAIDERPFQATGLTLAACWSTGVEEDGY
jgi:hypothetical protein